jgi:hypothetical protein
MPENLIHVDSGSGPVTVGIFIGQQQQAMWDLIAYDAKGHGGTIVDRGNNTDEQPDTYTIAQPLAAIDKTQMAWRIYVTPPTGPGGAYYVKVAFSQNDVVVPGGAFEYRGEMTAGETVFGSGRFIVV